MDYKILEFATLLRKAGVKVSHSEVSECLIALKYIGFDRTSFYNTLAATMIKDRSDSIIFDKVFQYYFDPCFVRHSGVSYLKPNLQCQAGEKNCTGSDIIPGSDEGRTTGFGQGQGLATSSINNFIQVIKLGSSVEMAAMVKKGVQSLGRLKEEDLTNMKNAIRQVKVFLEWNMGTYQLEQEINDGDESVWLIWQERIAEMEVMLNRELEKELIRQLGVEALETILIRENLNELDFYQLNSQQVVEIKKKVSKLAHKLATRLSFRQRRARRGKINLQKTIRKTIATGGVPISPVFKDRYPTRPEIVVLCDISGSVKIFSEFMLQLVFSIQSRFIHVRSFVFVDTPDEISQYFQNQGIDDGIKDMYNRGRFSKTSFSDYGQMFIDFCHKYLDVLNKKTTLLIIGDARNNYHSEHVDYLQKMAKEVNKLIWLNPEPMENWDSEDSIMLTYGHLCDQVFECRNLLQLDAVSRKII